MEFSDLLALHSVRPDVQWVKENGMDQKEYVVLAVTDTGTGIP